MHALLRAGNTEEMIKTTMPRIVLTRPQAAARRFAARLLAARPKADVVVSPILDISYRENVQLPEADLLVFTSVHGVEGHARLGGVKHPAFCVGETTASAVRALGYDVRAVAADSAVLETVLQEHPKKRLLHARGAYVAGKLAESNENLVEAIVYDQPARLLTQEAQEAFSGERAVVLPLFSPRSARELAKQIDASAPLYAVFMSPSVKEQFGNVPLVQSRIAQTASGDAMLEATVALFDAACALEGHGQGD